MSTGVSAVQPLSKTKAPWAGILIALGLAALSGLFVLLDQAYVGFADARFPNVGGSTLLANLWGVVSRAHLLIFLVPLAAWRPGWFGFQVGRIRQHWRMLLVMLLANCGVIAAYLWLTNSSTPYSANQWLVTEVITVPLVEETFWRGLVLGGLLLVLRKFYPETTSGRLAVWMSGLAFGGLHVANALTGVPILFAGVQALNAAIWGVVYGYARYKTDSLYPAVFLHAAMNLVVILF